MYFATFLVLTGAVMSPPETAIIWAKRECTGADVCIEMNTLNLCAALADQAIPCKWRSLVDPGGENLDSSPYPGGVEFPVSLKVGNGTVEEKTLQAAASGHPCGDYTVFAYHGESEEGYPLIETNYGLIEVVSPEFDVGYENARILIDPDTGSVVARLSAPNDNDGSFAYYYRSDTEIYLFDRDRCITAPGEGRGRLESAGFRCDLGAVLKAATRNTSGALSDVGLSVAQAGDVEMAAQASPWAAEYWGEFFPRRVSRIEGAEVIVVDLLDACT